MKLLEEYPTDYRYKKWPFEAIERLRMNKVQELTEEIKSIQEECLHINVTWVDTPEFRSSLVPRYFVLLNEASRFFMRFSTKCNDCSLVQNYYAKKTCPICFNEMKEVGWVHSGAGTGRMKYIGSSYVYYALLEFNCTNDHCSFKGVADEWNQ